MSRATSEVIDEFLAAFWARNPVTATFAGVHAHDARLPDWSSAGRAAEVAELRALSARLAAHAVPGDWRGLAADPVALDALVAQAVARVRVAEAESGFFTARNPALWTGEAIFGAVSLMLRDFAPDADRVASLTARLATVPAFLDTMRQEITGGVPAAWTARALRECGAAQQLLGEGLALWLDAHGAAPATDELRHAAQSAAAAFDRAASMLRTLPVDDTGAACGETLLSLLLRDGHMTDESPRALLARVDAALPEALRALADAIAPYGGSLAAAREAMANDHEAPADFVAAFGARWDAVRDAVVAADVVPWPHDWPLRYVQIPVWARAVQPQLYFLFYRSPAPFDPYTVHEYLVAPVDASTPAEPAQATMRAWNRSVIGTNHVLHHGGLGHHVQNRMAARGHSRLGMVTAVDAASRIAMFQGGSMAEGWACYATQLAGELGLLTPLEQISEAHSAVRFLGRAIIDLRLHLGDWTASTCARFLVDTVHMDEAQAAGEVTKASMFPGTALMYWLGTEGIVRTRTALQQAHGPAFSLRRFHEALLERGALPVPLVSRLLLAAEGVA